MHMVIDSAIFPEHMAVPPAGLGTYGWASSESHRDGDTFAFGAGRCGVEIVLGFKPGSDRIVIVADPAARNTERLLTTEDGGNAVIVDGLGRRIVIEGVRLGELVRGDIELGRSA